MITKSIKKWLKEQNISELTSVQNKSLPLIMKQKNVLITAPTGYGKTLAAIIPIFQKLVDNDSKGLNVLYIAPTKSLNRDIYRHVFDFAKTLGLSVGERHGDTTSYEKSKQSKNPPNILITTPESLQSLLISERLRGHLSKLKFVVIDEIHELISSKRGAQLSLGLERLERLAKFSRIGISATISDLNEMGKFLCGVRSFEIVQISEPKESSVKVIKVKPSAEDKVFAKRFAISPSLAAVMKSIKSDIEASNRVIVFVNTRAQTEILSHNMKRAFKKLSFGIHHSSLSKKQRMDMEESLKTGKIKALIATSSMELGIDVGSIDLIIQFMSPRQVSKLVQRVGRSGHAHYKKSKGKIYTLNDDDYLESKAIVNLMKKGYLEKPVVHFNALDVLTHQIIGFLRDNTGITLKQLHKTVNKSYCVDLSFDKFKELLLFLQSINYIHILGDKIIASKKSFFYYFRNVSMIPTIRTFKIINVETNSRVGSLHESFVLQYCNIGSVIIMRGEPWSILEVTEDTINVGRSRSFSGAVPAWTGELIPISYDVAREVYKLRKSFYEDKNVNDYFIETFEKNIIIHSCNGSKINNTLGIIFSSLISVKTGSSTGLRVDPYRVILTIPYSFSLREFKKLISKLTGEMVKDLVRLSVKNSTMFHTRFFNVGQRFGIISRDAEFIGSRINRIIESYSTSPIFFETLSEVMREKMEIDGARRAVIDLKSKITISTSNKISIIGYQGLQFGGFSGVFRTAESYDEIYGIVRERLFNKEFVYQCINCGIKFGTFSVKSFVLKKCPKCGAKTISFVPIGKEKNKKLLDETSNLFLVYGNRACFVLAAYGVGIRAGKRILANFTTEKELIKNIIHAEKTFVRTRRFWN